MYCTNCGKELTDDTRFCTECGTPVAMELSSAVEERAIPDTTAVIQDLPSAVSDTASSRLDTASATPDTTAVMPVAPSTMPHTTRTMPISGATNLDDGRPSASISQARLSQTEGSKRPALAGIAIAVAALAFLATIAFMFFLHPKDTGSVQESESLQAEQAESSTDAESATSTPEQSSPVQSESEQSEPELTEEEKALKSIEGWWDSCWHKPGYMPAFGQVHDGVIDWYRVGAESLTDTESVSYSTTVEITRVERFDENGTQGWRFFTSASPDNSWAYYLADGTTDQLPIFMTSDGYGVVTESNTDHPTRFGMTRIADGYDWSASMGTDAQFEQAKALAAERNSGTSAAKDDKESGTNKESDTGDYVLADSNTRAYGRGELEALDNHTLFLARNEIYARHGRGFKNTELRSYFAGKSWYHETVSPEAFDDNVLNETEKANANLMLDIEKSRNSPYLT